jgi:hypothetical protein
MDQSVGRAETRLGGRDVHRTTGRPHGARGVVRSVPVALVRRVR